MASFRIVENMGEFTIQKRVEITTGVFRKRKREEWRRVDINGFAIFDYIYQLPMESFKSLDGAKEKVKLIKKGTVYHEC